MATVVVNELKKLFELRDRRTIAIDRFIIAEAELQGNMQQNAHKDFLEISDLENTHKLIKPVSAAKAVLEHINAELEISKRFFTSLLEASGCTRFRYANNEVDEAGNAQQVLYVISLAKNINGDTDLLIHAI